MTVQVDFSGTSTRIGGIAGFLDASSAVPATIGPGLDFRGRVEGASAVGGLFGIGQFATSARLIDARVRSTIVVDGVAGGALGTASSNGPLTIERVDVRAQPESSLVESSSTAGVGGLIGFADVAGLDVKDVVVAPSIKANASTVAGGLVGEIITHGITPSVGLSRCSVLDADINGSQDVGGFFGRTLSPGLAIVDSEVAGFVRAAKPGEAAGIVASSNAIPVVVRFVSRATLQNPASDALLALSANGPNPGSDTFFDAAAANGATSAYGTGKTAEALQDAALYPATTWDKAWQLKPGTVPRVRHAPIVRPR